MVGIAFGAPLQLRLGFLFGCWVGFCLLSEKEEEVVLVVAAGLAVGDMLRAWATALAVMDARGVGVVVVVGGVIAVGGGDLMRRKVRILRRIELGQSMRSRSRFHAFLSCAT